MKYPLVNDFITMERSTHFFMGKFTISMAFFNSYVKLPEGNICKWGMFHFHGPCLIPRGYNDKETSLVRKHI